MLFDLMEHWPIRIEESLMIGDTDSDLAAASAAGVRGLRFTGGNLLELVSVELADRRGSDQ
jgi:D-glycero-D-manno-heptose 1,7-bisphosphate phosphatase